MAINKLLIIIALLVGNQSVAQSDSIFESRSTTDGSAFSILLDSVVISDFKNGIDIPFFIQKMQEDESFYRAFKNIRFATFDFKNLIQFFDKKDNLIAYYSADCHQDYDKSCRSMMIMKDTFFGDNFNRSGSYKYYTMKLYDRLFFTKGQVCNDEPEKIDLSDNSNSHITELKKLIFKPGSKADVPFIGSKMAIFSKEMSKYYDFRLLSTSIKGRDCYSFIVKVKSEVELNNKDQTVVKYLETFFDKSNFQVFGRNYQLMYKGFWFDFDVKMNIELTKIGNKYFPQKINYDGYWDVPMKKPEKAKFETIFKY